MLLLFVAIDQRIAMASPIVLTETSQKPKPKPILDSPKPDAGASSGTESRRILREILINLSIPTSTCYHVVGS
jgi:hypothetical protein